MVIFIKDFNYSAEMTKMKSRFNTELYKYGLVGEEKVAYQLKKSNLNILCAYNIRLQINKIKLQFDFIAICKDVVFIIEVKNLFGNIYFNSDGNVIREIKKNGIIERSSMENPIIQINNHVKCLKEYIDKHGYIKKIVGVLVMANDKMIITNESDYKNIIKYDELNEFFTLYTENNQLTNEEFRLAEMILKEDREYNYHMISIIKDNINRQYVPNFANAEDKELYVRLIKLRYELHKRLNIPTCNIYNNRDAEELVKLKPKTKEEFILVKGFKEKKYNMYGKEIINIFKNFN